jgi:hypothetical protein
MVLVVGSVLASSVVLATLPVFSRAFCALLHSLALCPVPPQYRQRPCAIRRSRSVCVSPPCGVRCAVMGDAVLVSRGVVIAGAVESPAWCYERSSKGFHDSCSQHGNNAIPGWYSHGIWLSHDKYPTAIMPLYSVVNIQNAFY